MTLIEVEIGLKLLLIIAMVYCFHRFLKAKKENDDGM